MSAEPLPATAEVAPSDAELVDRVLAGQDAAATLLLARHRDHLLALCFRLVRDPFLAEDCAQDASLAALLHLHRLTSREQFGPWLRGIGIRHCRRALRARAIEQRRTSPGSAEASLVSLSALPGEADPHSFDDALSLSDLSHTLRAALGTLPSGQRDAVRHFYLRALSYEATAAALGITVGALKVRLHKARLALRQYLNPPLGDAAGTPGAPGTPRGAGRAIHAAIPPHVMAIHEAGHAIVHLLNGGLIHRISIAATDLTPGVGTREQAGSHLSQFPAYQLLTTTMAGEAAELQAHPGRRYRPNLGDRPTAGRIAHTLTGGDPVEAALVVEQARRAARECLALPRNWRLVERVRTALLAHPILDGDDLRRLTSR